MTTEIQQIQFRRNTAAAWAADNPILKDGEPGLDVTNRELRIGDGASVWADLPVVVDSGVLGDYLTTAAASATYLPFLNAAKNPDIIITGAVTRNTNGVVTSAAVIWPDGTAGTFTTDSIGALGTIDGYHITYGNPATKTYTQPTITRDPVGRATTVPAMVVS